MGLLPHLQPHYGPRPPVGLFCAPRVGMGQKISHQRAPRGITRRGSGHMSEPLFLQAHPLTFVPDDALALLFFWR